MSEHTMPNDDDMTELNPEVAAALRAIDPVAAAVRQSAIDAALTAVTVAPIASVRRQRSIRMFSSLAGAAAAVILIVVGMTAVNSGGDDVARMSADTETAALEPAPDSAASDAYSTKDYDEPAAAEPAADASAAEEPSAEATMALEMDAAGAAPATADTPVISSLGELVDQTDLMADLVRSGANEPPHTDCVMIGGGPVGLAMIDGFEAALFRDLATGTYTALAIDDCRTLLQTIVTP